MRQVKRHELLDIIPPDQLEAVFSSDMCDIDCEFMGFTETYKALASIIPKHFTIIDFGCAFAPQVFYFENHKRYIGVDVCSLDRFHAANTEHYQCSIQEFISNSGLYKLPHPSEIFAICNYMPDDNAAYLVRHTFPNVYTFYPS